MATSSPQVLDTMGGAEEKKLSDGVDVHAAETEPPAPTDWYTCKFDAVDEDGVRVDGDCLSVGGDGMPCTDEKCNSPEAYAEEQLDANHCINGCPLEALQRVTWIAEHVDTTDPDALETFIARHPLRATASMKAAYKATYARRFAAYHARLAAESVATHR